jgi:hypothetical protein
MQMWTLEKPNIPALEAFNTCIAGISDADLKQRLQDIRGDIDAGETAFDDAAESSSLYLIAATGNVGAVTAKEMEKLYDRHMARSRSRGRAIYDKLMIAAKNDMCPLCGHRNVSTLDHSLPKAAHPTFAVTPINLIPSCKDCNHGKGNRSPTTSEDQLLNAYYDDVTADCWLYAEIVEGSPPAARFFVDAPDDWEDGIATRVRNHFNALHLAKLYASQAGRQFQNMRGSLGEIMDAAGVDAVRADLERRFRSCRDVMVNSWEGALYQAAAASDWYCNNGFRA